MPLDPERMWNVAGHVQAKTIDASARIAVGREPAPGDREDMRFWTGTEARFTVLFKHRQGAVAAGLGAAIPGNIFDRRIPVAHVEPVGVFTIFAVLEHVLKRPEFAAHMVKHTVKNHFETHRMGLGDEVEKKFV